MKVGLAGAMSIQDGGLSGTYHATQFHFHWGANDSVGSEHTIDTKPYPLEVSYNKYR